MLSVTKPSANRMDIELSALIDADMMSAGLEEMFELSKDIEDGVLMYKIPSFSMPTGRAVMIEMMRLPQVFKMIGHFSKCAVVTDIAWLRTAAQVEGALIPGLEIRTFEASQEAAAESWLAQVEQEEDDHNFPV